MTRNPKPDAFFLIVSIIVMSAVFQYIGQSHSLWEKAIVFLLGSAIVLTIMIFDFLRQDETREKEYQRWLESLEA